MSSKNFGSILIFESCVFGTCNILIGVSHTACKDEFRRNLRSHSWSILSFFLICYICLLFSFVPKVITHKSCKVVSGVEYRLQQSVVVVVSIHII